MPARLGWGEGDAVFRHGWGRRAGHPSVTITIDGEHPGPVVPDDFAGLSFERGPLNPRNAGVSGNLFSPANNALVTLFRNLGLGNLRIGGGTVDQLIPAGTGSDGFTGIDNLFAFAAVAGVKVIYSLRLISQDEPPIGDLKAVHAQATGHIWRHHRESVASFAIGNEPDWPAYHRLDPAIFEEASEKPGSAYPVLPDPVAEHCRRDRGRGAGSGVVWARPRGL